MWVVGFYLAWAIVGGLLVRNYIFEEVWKTRKDESGFVKRLKLSTKVYKKNYISTLIRTQFSFLVGAIFYIGVILIFHYCAYEWKTDFTWKEIWLQSAYIVALILSLCMGDLSSEEKVDKVDYGNSMRNIAKVLFILRDKIITGAVEREELEYRSFIKCKTNEIGDNEHLRILFILKFTDVQLRKIFESVSLEAIEILPQMLLEAHQNDAIFKELMESIFIKDFINMEIPIQDIIGIFQYCTIEELKHRDRAEDTKAFKKIVKRFDDAKKGRNEIAIECGHSPYPVKEVDLNEVL